MYPLTISADAGRDLLLQLAQASQALETQPRFYNTLTSNCTNELAKAANQVKPDAIPLNMALVFPGYSNEVLHQLGFLPNDVSLDELNRRFFITDLVAAEYQRVDFSQALRADLRERASLPPLR